MVFMEDVMVKALAVGTNVYFTQLASSNHL